MVTATARPRNASATRDAILQAAVKRFASESYDDVGMRDLARDVGVDPALIVRYFGSKEELFAEAVNCCDADEEIMSQPRETFGRRLAHEIVFDAASVESTQQMQILLRSVSSEKAKAIVQKAAVDQFVKPFEAWIDKPDAAIRVRLAAGLMMGMEMTKELLGKLQLTPDECKELERRLAAMLQSIIDDD